MDYNKLYKLFDDCFPVNADCGLLCESACCKGDENTGMLLFPHEKTSHKVKEVNGKALAVCCGKCDRFSRPLSCRIFPFFPVIDESGKITAEIDYRGLGICPMVAHSDKIRFNRRFLRHVRICGKILSRDSECLELLKEIGDEIHEQKKLTYLFK